MNILFILISIFGGCYFLFKNRGFDLISLAFFSAIIYFLPLYFGYVYEPYIVNGKYFFQRNDLTYYIYIVGIIVILSILISGIIFDSTFKVTKRYEIDLNINKIFLSLFTILLWLSLVYLFIQNGGSLFTGKLDVLSKSHVASIFLRSSTVYFTVAMLSKKKIYIINALLIYLICFLIGIRSFIAIGILAYILILLMKYKKPLYKMLNMKLLATLLVLGYLMINGKYIYSNFQLYGLSGLINSIFDYKITLTNIEMSEPFAIQMILNKTISTDFHSGIIVIRDAFLDFFYFDKIFNIETYDFNKVFTSNFFGYVDYGLAYNIWAEAYSIGGFIYIIIFCVIFNIILLIINLFLLKIESIEMQGLIAVIGTFFAFYIHRNSLSNILTINKTIFVFVFLIILLSVIIKVFLSSNTKFITYKNKSISR